MSEPKAKPPVELAGADPKKIFYIWADLNLDGSVDLETEAKTIIATKEDALRDVREMVDENGGEYYVIECRCVYMLKRGATRVIPIKAKS